MEIMVIVAFGTIGVILNICGYIWFASTPNLCPAQKTTPANVDSIEICRTNKYAQLTPQSSSRHRPESPYRSRNQMPDWPEIRQCLPGLPERPSVLLACVPELAR